MPSSSGAFFAGSVFGPVTYAPCPVLMFRERSGAIEGGDSDNNSGRREFLAHGSMLGADADRIVLKRIILTGYPTRVHKRHATVKYMFYNPEDVKVRVVLLF
jgi:pre-rRNA-processing protein TSR1